METIDNIRSEALKLSLPQRAELARDLIMSLEDSESDPNAAEAWAEEIEARSAAYAGGEAEAVDWRESVSRVREALQQRRAQ